MGGWDNGQLSVKGRLIGVACVKVCVLESHSGKKGWGGFDSDGREKE